MGFTAEQKKKAVMKCILRLIFVRPHLTNKHLFGLGSVCIGYFGKTEGWGLQKIQKCRKIKCKKSVGNKDFLERSSSRLFCTFPLKVSFFWIVTSCYVMMNQSYWWVSCQEDKITFYSALHSFCSNEANPEPYHAFM